MPKFGQALQLRFPSKDKLAIKATTETDDRYLFLVHSLQKKKADVTPSTE